MKKYITAVLLCSIGHLDAQTYIAPQKVTSTTFAIIVDDKTFQGAEKELIAYKESVENDGLGTYIIHAQWKNPNEIRTVLYNLYTDKKHPLEGAVFVGDIPIPMIRGAQFLTSAFKMPETVTWEKSSVASDRFYDDFDLRFDFLQEDKKHSNYYYYNLSADSPQYIDMDIYSARIKPPLAFDINDNVELIKNYLKKLVALRKENNPLDHMLVSTAYGYNSESTLAWAAEMTTIKSSFPRLFSNGNEIKFLNYRNNRFLKSILLPALQREDMDFAFMTGHGEEEAQLMNGYPQVSTPGESMENVARYIRSKMNTAKENGKNLDSVKKNYQMQLGLNDKWFDDAFSSERKREDTLFNNNLEIHGDDLKNINVRVAYINSCLTGSFHQKDYLAGHYVFSNGKNIVAFGNTVGVLQDLWGTQLLGILQDGVRTGHLLKKTAFLETHLFGDPTFHFRGSKQDFYNTLFGKKNTTALEWNTLLQMNDADIQAYALTELFKQKSEAVFSKTLLSYFKNSPYESVRTQAYFLLRKYQNADFRSALISALSDNYEFLKRKAVYDAIEYGGDDIITPLVRIYLQDREAERVQYKLSSIFQFGNGELLKAELDKQLKGNPNSYNIQDLYTSAFKKISTGKSATEKSEKMLRNHDATDKELLFEIRTLKAYRNHHLVPALLDIAKDTSKSQSLRLATLETLSWFGLSVHQKEIKSTCEQLLNNSNDTTLKTQALKTINVMKAVGMRQL
ncbi:MULTISPECIES: HEAT repeat domain-containing protein [Chitinophagaceae]